MNKIIIGLVLITVFALGGMVVVLQKTPEDIPSNEQTSIEMVDGKQVITIKTKGGYAPKLTLAKANIPTILNMRTSGTYDCSAVLTVPAAGFRGNLPASGLTPIELPPQAAGTSIKGVCAMGMYSFTVKFE